MGKKLITGISDVLFFGTDEADNPVLIPVDTELFWDSFKHFWDFKDCLKRDCEKVWKFLSEEFEGSEVPEGTIELIPDHVGMASVFSGQKLNQLTRGIELVLLGRFRRELRKTFDEWDDITYGEELMNYHRAFSRLENALSMYVRLFEIRDCNETDSFDDVPEVILNSKAMFEKPFYAVIYRT